MKNWIKKIKKCNQRKKKLIEGLDQIMRKMAKLKQKKKDNKYFINNFYILWNFLKWKVNIFKYLMVFQAVFIFKSGKKSNAE